MTMPYQPQPYFHKGPPPEPPLNTDIINGAHAHATNRYIADGAWSLTIHITDMRIARTLQVKGDLHIGGLMLKLVEAIG